jgi:hypothetical protein
MSQDAMLTERVEADLRDLGQNARNQTMEYSLESGWKATRDVPLQRPDWIEVAEDGTLQVTLKGLRAKLGPNHFLNLDFSKPRDFIPLPINLDVIRSMLSEKKAVNNAHSITACGPILNILVPTPPLYCLLYACPLDKNPEEATRLSPVIGASSLVMRYILIKELLLGNEELDRERRTDARNCYEQGLRLILAGADERSFRGWMMKEFERFAQQMNTPMIQSIQNEEEGRVLTEMCRVLCSTTISTIRNLENCILMLLDKDLDPAIEPPKSMLCESQIVQFDDVPPNLQETAERDLNEDMSRFTPFRLKFMQMYYEVAPFPIPERLELKSGSLPGYPISIEALKLHCATLFMADQFERQKEAEAKPRTAASLASVRRQRDKS